MISHFFTRPFLCMRERKAASYLNRTQHIKKGAERLLFVYYWFWLICVIS